jgi:hypothetical protein
MGSVAAVLGLVLTWQQLGGWIPASAQSVERLSVKLGETTLLVLYARLERLERDLKVAIETSNQEWAFSLGKQIEEVNRQIKRIEGK